MTAAERGTDEASGNVLVGYGTRPAPRRVRGPRRHSVSASSAPALADASAAAGSASPPGVAIALARQAGPVPVISPIVRKLARQAGLDLARIAGTGPRGLVLRRDVNQAEVAALGQARLIRSPSPGEAPDPRYPEGGGGEADPLAA